jgi:hypothetical protein
VRIILPFLVMTGCDTKTMSESWQLDRLRLLGVRAEVAGVNDPILGTRAEPRPGETVGFRQLTYSPSQNAEVGSIWFACLTDGADAYGCDIDQTALEAFDALDDDSTVAQFTAAIEAAQAAGLIGLPPLFQPEWTIPADALSGLSEAERLEGLSAVITVSLINEDFKGGDEDSGDPTSREQDEAEVGFKRMPVSEALTPNHNPDIVDFTVAGERLNGAVGFTARRGSTYIIDPIVPDAHIETYTYLNSSGEDEFRTEEPFFTWYTELGSDVGENQARFDQPLSLAPSTSVEWTAPTNPTTVHLYVVVRDRRGGMGWRSLKVNVL